MKTDHYARLSVIERDGIAMMLGQPSEGAADGLMSAMDRARPSRLVLPYTRSLFCAMFMHPEPRRILALGLGGGSFQRMCLAAWPSVFVQSVEIDLEVIRACINAFGFTPTERCPVSLFDARRFIQEDKSQWDWIVADIFRGLAVPPHVRTAEYYAECAERLSPRGVFVLNLFSNSTTYFHDLKTILSVFPQVVLFGCENHGYGNVIVCAVKYIAPFIAFPEEWPATTVLHRAAFDGSLDVDSLRREMLPFPHAIVDAANVIRDADFPQAYEENNR